MKRILFTAVIAAAMVACKHTPQQDQTTVTTDTTGLAQYQAWKAQNELNNTTPPQNQVVTTQSQPEVVTTQPTTITKTKVVHVYEHPRRVHSHYTTVTSSSSYTAKRGWSKRAKYGVIGGVTGGVLGAVINKRNRAAGGIIGAVIGGGGGYLIGKHKDKQNGRY